MMKRFWLGTLLSTTLLLTACSNTNDDIIVSSTLGDLTQQQFYEEMLEIAGPSMLEQIITQQLLEEKYSVSEEEVTTEFETLKESYGDTFAETIEANGLTEESLRANIYFSLLRDKAVTASGQDFDTLMADLLEQSEVTIEHPDLQHIFEKYTQPAEKAENEE
ncbi:hypothetical protein [Caryophanon tenue]|uniref:peptidylprolyl isomerase n=1 Tax=Caryophanon tenue TaxID=33978 RepID=A0A1C0YIP7_9BACL|nr:hypothetical protein [Caryophanon tenue]OCS87023.1 hypothetical protein A6M13_11715 [Caryophanon tenue]